MQSIVFKFLDWVTEEMVFRKYQSGKKYEFCKRGREDDNGSVLDTPRPRNLTGT